MGAQGQSVRICRRESSGKMPAKTLALVSSLGGWQLCGNRSPSACQALPLGHRPANSQSNFESHADSSFRQRSNTQFGTTPNLSLAHRGQLGRLERDGSHCFVTVLYSDLFLRSLDLNSPRALPPQIGVDGMAGGIPEHSLDILSWCVVRVAAREGRHSREPAGARGRQLRHAAAAGVPGDAAAAAV